MQKFLRIAKGLLLASFILLKYFRFFYSFTSIFIRNITNKNRGNLYILVGYSKAGKTHYYINNEELSQYCCISTNCIHSLLNEKIIELRDDNTVVGDAYYARQILTHFIRIILVKKLIKHRYSFVVDACNLKEKQRRKIIERATYLSYHNISVVVIHCPEKILLERLRQADEENVKNDEKETWVALHNNQKLAYEPPRGNVRNVNGYEST